MIKYSLLTLQTQNSFKLLTRGSHILCKFVCQFHHDQLEIMFREVIIFFFSLIFGKLSHLYKVLETSGNKLTLFVDSLILQVHGSMRIYKQLGVGSHFQITIYYLISNYLNSCINNNNLSSQPTNQPTTTILIQRPNPVPLQNSAKRHQD